MNRRPGRSREVLVAPSTGDASGVVSYVVAVARLLPDAPAVYLALPGSDLDLALPATARRLPVGAGRSGLIQAIRRHAPRFAAVQTHGARALLGATLAPVDRRCVHHVYHELPSIQGPRGWLEIVLGLRVRGASNSQYLADHLRRYGLQTTVLPPLLPPGPLLSRDTARARLSIDEDAVAIGVVGRLHPAKAPELALAAVAALPRDLRERTMTVFVGEGPMLPVIGHRAGQLGCRVRLAGRVADARSVMRAFDLLVAPSRHETFCLALAEAIEAEVPVAAVRSWGSRLLSDDGRLLRLATSEASDLAASMMAGLSAPCEARARLRSHVQQAFAGRAAAASHAEYLARISAGRP